MNVICQPCLVGVCSFHGSKPHWKYLITVQPPQGRLSSSLRVQVGCTCQCRGKVRMTVERISWSITIKVIWVIQEPNSGRPSQSPIHYSNSYKIGRPWPSGWGRWLQTTCPSPLWVRIPTGTWILSCKDAIQLVYRTLMVQLLFRYPLVPEIILGRAPEFFLH
jgi:hypothetical protein